MRYRLAQARYAADSPILECPQHQMIWSATELESADLPGNLRVGFERLLCALNSLLSAILS